MRARLLCMGLLVAGALGLVAAPGAAQINIGITVGTPPPPHLVIPVPPQLVVIPQTQVFYAPAAPYNYFFYSGKYYVSHEGAWFVAPAHQGPWTFVAVERVPKPLLRVPVAYYKGCTGIAKKKARHHGRATAKDTNTRSTKTAMISECREEGTRGIACMIHASRLVSPDSPHAPEMLWE